MAEPKRTGGGGRHRAPDQPTDIVNTRGEARRRPEQHGPPKKPRAKKATPVSAAPVTAPLLGRPGPSQRPHGGNGERSRALREEAREHARRAELRTATGGKPSITGRAAGGAAAGAAAGGVVAGPPGAAVGGVLGGVGGGISGAKAKHAYKVAMRTNGRMRKAIVAEFAICLVIAALSPLTDKRKTEGAATYMKRLTAVMGVFLILGLISGIGRNAARFAAGVGGLMTVALAVSERDLFTKVANIFGSADRPDSGPGPDIGEIAGGTLGDVQVEA